MQASALPLGHGAVCYEGTVVSRTAGPFVRAGNRTRTGDPNLGKVVLYQLSYSRIVLLTPYYYRRSDVFNTPTKPVILSSV